MNNKAARIQVTIATGKAYFWHLFGLTITGERVKLASSTSKQQLVDQLKAGQHKGLYTGYAVDRS